MTVFFFGNRIIGFRYHCTDQECPDFDVCEKCYMTRQVELTNHTLEQIRANFLCGLCQKVILGIQHHCTKCADHNICDKCMFEKEGEILSDHEHAFVPLRKDGSVDQSDYRHIYSVSDLY